MYSVLLLTVLAQPVPKDAAPGGTPPVQMLARIDIRGNLTITNVASMNAGCYGAPGPVPEVIPVPRGDRPRTAPAKAPVKVTVTHLVVTTAELPAKDVEAYTATGRPVTAEKLATLLAKERTVLIATDGKKVDPFLLQLYKEDVLVLVPPANTFNTGFGGYGTPLGGGYTYPPPPPSSTPYKEFPAPRRIPDESKR